MKKKTLSAFYTLFLIALLVTSSCIDNSNKSVVITFVQDISDSVPRTECLGHFLENVFVNYKNYTKITMLTFATGDKTSSNEPKLITENHLETKADLVKGRNAGEIRFNEMTTTIKQSWEKVVPTKESPIFQGVARAIEQTQSHYKGDHIDYVIYVKTDLEETVSPELKDALNSDSKSKKKLTNLPKINNDKVQVIFIGVAETLGENLGSTKTRLRTPQKVEYLQQVWLSLFTKPELVRFEPFCR